MTNYFTDVASKSALSGSKVWTDDDARPDLLLKHYKQTRNLIFTPEKVLEIDSMYMKWCELILSGFNVVVHGQQSKFTLLETFKARYLDSNKLPDYKAMLLATNGSIPRLNLTTIRLHGLDAISLDVFTHSMFGIKERRKVKREDYSSFISRAKKNSRHYLFLIHSIDSFIIEQKPVFDVICELYRMNSEYIHLVASTDLINAGKFSNTLKFKLNLVSFAAPFGEPFLFERSLLETAGLDLIDNANDITAHKIFDTEKQDLESLKDVYNALTRVREVMIYILKDFVTKSQQRPVQSTDLDFNELMRYCESNFITRRGAQLKTYLGELVDHNVITETANKIKCKIRVETCKKFIEFVETVDR